MTPADLAHLPIWVAWRAERHNGKLTKVPYAPRTGRRASSTDPATWATRREAGNWAATHGGAGVGVVLCPIDGAQLAGVDLDSCRDPQTGAVEAWAESIIGRLQTYSEVSPSGTGVKLVFRIAPADMPAVEALMDGKQGRQFRNGGGEHGPAIEVYCGGRYFAVTDDAISDSDELRQVGLGDLRWLLRDAGPRFAGKDNSRSAKAFRAGAALVARGASYEEMRDELLNHPDADVRAWAREKGLLAHEREMRRVYEKAKGSGTGKAVSLDDFHAYMPMHNYIFGPSGQTWPAGSVDARILPVPVVDEHGNTVVDDKGKPKTLRASAWLDKNRPVEQMSWAPGLPTIIADRLVCEGGWIERKGAHCFNLYRPPTIELGDPDKASPWIRHGERIYGDEFEHIYKWFAQRIQRPAEKINHALVLGGPPGIGKDTLIEPVKRAVGPWNFAEVSPKQILGRFNGFLKATILRINEAHDLGEFDRFAFYDATKSLIAAPPDVLRIDEKHLNEYAILNCVGPIVTSNHKTDGLYLPADDRRHYVAWSNLLSDAFRDGYWAELWSWYENGGYGHVAAYLAALDLSGFDPKAPPPKTPAFWDIADASRAPENAELADVLDKLKNPPALTLAAAQNAADGGEGSLGEWLQDRKNRRQIPHRFEQCGYAPVRNDAAPADGLWKIKGRRQAIYASTCLSRRDQLAAAGKLAAGQRWDGKQWCQ
jgi:hypothetical protein